MKIRTYITAIPAALTLLLATASCGSDDNYTPGPEVSQGNQNVYFSNENQNELLVTSDGDKSVSLKVVRKATSGNLTVPVVTDSKNGDLNIPESVTFEDGDSIAELKITYTTFTVGMKFSIHLSDDYTNPYVEKAGSTHFMASLEQLNKVCTVSYASDTRFAGVTTSAIYAYNGQNKFVWKDFLGSGLDMMFTVDTSKTEGAAFDASDLSKLKGDIIPKSNYTTTDSGWYLTDGLGTKKYPTWTPAGSDEPVTKFLFWSWYSYSYSFIDFSPKAGYGGYFYSAVVNGNYENIYFHLNF